MAAVDDVTMSERFRRVSGIICPRAAALANRTSIRCFRSVFGVSPEACSIIWRHLNSKNTDGLEPRHLLIGLLFLKVYSTETVHAAILGLDEKTLRKWQLITISCLSQLDLVSGKFSHSNGANVHRFDGHLVDLRVLFSMRIFLYMGQTVP